MVAWNTLHNTMTTKAKQKEFERQYHKLFQYAYRYMSFRIPNAHDCEDMVSDLFLQAYERIDQYDPEKGTLKQ